MIYAQVDESGLILNTAVADSANVFPEGTWVICPDWLGIGLNINDPMPEPVVLHQPTIIGAQTL